MLRDGDGLRDGEGVQKHRPAMRLVSSWMARFVVPALANRAAGVEMTARRWVEDGAPRRRVLQARVAARPLGALAAFAGTAYLLTVIGRRRRG